MWPFCRFVSISDQYAPTDVGSDSQVSVYIVFDIQRVTTVLSLLLSALRSLSLAPMMPRPTSRRPATISKTSTSEWRAQSLTLPKWNARRRTSSETVLTSKLAPAALEYDIQTILILTFKKRKKKPTKLGELAIQAYVLPLMEFHVNRYINLAFFFGGGRRGEGSASLLFIIRKRDPFCTDCLSSPCNRFPSCDLYLNLLRHWMWKVQRCQIRCIHVIWRNGYFLNVLELAVKGRGIGLCKIAKWSVLSLARFNSTTIYV